MKKNKIVQEITTFYIVLSCYDGKKEGITAVHLNEDFPPFPLITENLKEMDKMRDYLKKLSRKDGQKFYICRFDRKEVLETIHETH